MSGKYNLSWVRDCLKALADASNAICPFKPPKKLTWRILKHAIQIIVIKASLSRKMCIAHAKVYKALFLHVIFNALKLFPSPENRYFVGMCYLIDLFVRSGRRSLVAIQGRFEQMHRSIHAVTSQEMSHIRAYRKLLRGFANNGNAIAVSISNAHRYRIWILMFKLIAKLTVNWFVALAFMRSQTLYRYHYM